MSPRAEYLGGASRRATGPIGRTLRQSPEATEDLYGPPTSPIGSLPLLPGNLADGSPGRPDEPGNMPSDPLLSPAGNVPARIPTGGHAEYLGGVPGSSFGPPTSPISYSRPQLYDNSGDTYEPLGSPIGSLLPLPGNRADGSPGRLDEPGSMPSDPLLPPAGNVPAHTPIGGHAEYLGGVPGSVFGPPTSPISYSHPQLYDDSGDTYEPLGSPIDSPLPLPGNRADGNPGRSDEPGSTALHALQPPDVDMRPTVGWFVNGRTSLGTKFSLVPMDASADVSAPTPQATSTSPVARTDNRTFYPDIRSPSPQHSIGDRMRLGAPDSTTIMPVADQSTVSSSHTGHVGGSPRGSGPGPAGRQSPIAGGSTSRPVDRTTPGTYSKSLLRMAEESTYRSGERLTYLRGESRAWKEVVVAVQRADLTTMMKNAGEWSCYNEILCSIGEEWYPDKTQ